MKLHPVYVCDATSSRRQSHREHAVAIPRETPAFSRHRTRLGGRRFIPSPPPHDARRAFICAVKAPRPTSQSCEQSKMPQGVRQTPSTCLMEPRMFALKALGGLRYRPSRHRGRLAIATNKPDVTRCDKETLLGGQRNISSTLARTA